VGQLSLDRARRQAWLKGVPLRLSAREFRLLEVLMANAGQALSRQQLLDAVWGPDWVGDPHTLEVRIRWLSEAPPVPLSVQVHALAESAGGLLAVLDEEGNVVAASDDHP